MFVKFGAEGRLSLSSFLLLQIFFFFTIGKARESCHVQVNQEKEIKWKKLYPMTGCISIYPVELQ